jgi:hypothetical protein
LDSSFNGDDEDDDEDDADPHAYVDDEEKDDADDNANKYGNTDDNASEKDNEGYKTVCWDSGGELIFVNQVSIIITTADNHYPGFMLNSKQINDALQHAIILSLTAKITYSDVEDRNYMETISQNEEVKEADQEKADHSPLGAQAYVVVNE